MPFVKTIMVCLGALLAVAIQAEAAGKPDELVITGNPVLRTSEFDAEWLEQAKVALSAPPEELSPECQFNERELPVLRQHVDRARRFCNVLALRRDDGKWMQLVDIIGLNAGFFTGEHYRLKDYIERIRTYIVLVDYGEASEHLAFSSVTGDFTGLVFAPQLSPDGR